MAAPRVEAPNQNGESCTRNKWQLGRAAITAGSRSQMGRAGQQVAAPSLGLLFVFTPAARKFRVESD